MIDMDKLTSGLLTLPFLAYSLLCLAGAERMQRMALDVIARYPAWVRNGFIFRWVSTRAYVPLVRVLGIVTLIVFLGLNLLIFLKRPD